MSFGLKNAAQSFQRFMNDVFFGLDFIFVHIDDILIASKNNNEQFKDLKIVFERLNTFGLKIKPEKCEFNATSLTFLNHDISKAGIRKSFDRVKIKNDFPQPTTCKGLHRFIGMVHYNHRFISNLTLYISLLYEMKLNKKTKWYCCVVWYIFESI